MKLASKAKVAKVRDKLKIALVNKELVSLVLEVSESIKQLDEIVKE